MDISVIIPVYNTEKYLDRCIQSVIDQVEVSIEIILVDDGSIDNSSKICDKYSELYSNINTIHIENSGPSTAKNIGYQRAKGDYIAFIDSDDKICNNMFAKMISSARNNNAEIVCCNYLQIDENGRISHDKYTNKEYILNQNEGIKSLLIKDKIYSQCWTKIYKHEMLEKYDIHNVDGLKTEEDFIFNIKAFIHSNIITIVDEPLYIYTHRESSLSKDYFRNNISQYIDNRIMRLEFVDNTIRIHNPQLIEFSTFHCLFYYNELIGKVSFFPILFKDQRIKNILLYFKENRYYLNKYHNECGISKYGVFLLLYLPSYFYLIYRNYKARNI